jgi:hypothetical protein
MNSRAFFVAFCVLGAPGTAIGASQVCIEINTVYADAGYALTNGVKEDYWQSQSYMRPPRGADFTLLWNGVPVSTGHLGDGSDPNVPIGCTPSVQTYAGTYFIYVYSQGIVNGNRIVSLNHNRSTRSVYSYLGALPAGQSTVQITPVGSGQTDTAELEDVFEAYNAGAFALYRHTGGEVNNWYYFYRCSCNSTTCTVAGNPFGGDCSCSGTPGACMVGGNASNNWTSNAYGSWRVSSMSPNGSGQKFKLIHEMGHQIATTVTDSVANGGNCSDSDVFPCDSGGHAMWSREFSRCAFKEAFAHFYAADVWNSHSQTDCAFKYYKSNGGTQAAWAAVDGPMIDCAADDGPDPGTGRDDFSNGQDFVPQDAMEASWMKDQCTPPYAGKGAEVDWMRVFWGLHTDGVSPPSFDTVAAWIRDCGPVGDTTAYQELNDCANSRPGPDPLKTNWSVNVPSVGHGINY